MFTASGSCGAIAGAKIALATIASRMTLAATPHRRRPRRRSDPWSAVGSSAVVTRSEEHTSELQSQSNLVCRLLLEKKKRNMYMYQAQTNRHVTAYAATDHPRLTINPPTPT